MVFGAAPVSGPVLKYHRRAVFSIGAGRLAVRLFFHIWLVLANFFIDISHEYDMIKKHGG